MLIWPKHIAEPAHSKNTRPNKTRTIPERYPQSAESDQGVSNDTAAILYENDTPNCERYPKACKTIGVQFLTIFDDFRCLFLSIFAYHFVNLAICTYMHIHTHIHTYAHTHIHAYTHTYSDFGFRQIRPYRRTVRTCTGAWAHG